MASSSAKSKAKKQKPRGIKNSEEKAKYTCDPLYKSYNFLYKTKFYCQKTSKNLETLKSLSEFGCFPK